ncbi:MAG TPA: hypothetical protein VF329_10810 [Gammaproteobacteria bacterium]
MAFPVYYRVAEELLSAATYASLMRETSQRNGGTFVALSSCDRCGPARDRPPAPQ